MDSDFDDHIEVSGSAAYTPLRQGLTVIPFAETGFTAGTKTVDIGDGVMVEVAYITVDSDFEFGADELIGTFVLYGEVDEDDETQLLEVDERISLPEYCAYITCDYLSVDIDTIRKSGSTDQSSSRIKLIPYNSTNAFNITDTTPPAKVDDMGDFIIIDVSTPTDAIDNHTLNTTGGGFDHTINFGVNVRTYLVEVILDRLFPLGDPVIKAGSEFQLSLSCSNNPFEEA